MQPSHQDMERMGRIQYNNLSSVWEGWDVFITTSLKCLVRMGRIQCNNLSRIWRGWDVFITTISPGYGEDRTYSIRPSLQDMERIGSIHSNLLSRK